MYDGPEVGDGFAQAILEPDCGLPAQDDAGEIMALRHCCYDVRGIQFHPESVLTPKGIELIANWLNA